MFKGPNVAFSNPQNLQQSTMQVKNYFTSIIKLILKLLLFFYFYQLTKLYLAQVIQRLIK